jgi:uncharacterized YkwD family protein
MRNMKRNLIAFICIMLLSSASFLHAPSSGHAAGGTYVVKPGDTLWKIAKTHNLALSELLAHNPNLQKPGSIVPNQVIRIPSVGSTTQAWEQQVVKLVNAERIKAGLNPLKSDWELARVARYKSMDMRDRNYFAHQSPTYGSPFDMIQSFAIDYRYAGENIAAGQRSPEEVVKSWMNSSGHRANILNRNFTKIGVGFIQGGTYQTYWTQLFTG